MLFNINPSGVKIFNVTGSLSSANDAVLKTLTWNASTIYNWNMTGRYYTSSSKHVDDTRDHVYLEGDPQYIRMAGMAGGGTAFVDITTPISNYNVLSIAIEGGHMFTDSGHENNAGAAGTIVSNTYTIGTYDILSGTWTLSTYDSATSNYVGINIRIINTDSYSIRLLGPESRYSNVWAYTDVVLYSITIKYLG